MTITLADGTSITVHDPQIEAEARKPHTPEFLKVYALNAIRNKLASVDPACVEV